MKSRTESDLDISYSRSRSHDFDVFTDKRPADRSTESQTGPSTRTSAFSPDQWLDGIWIYFNVSEFLERPLIPNSRGTETQYGNVLLLHLQLTANNTGDRPV